MSGLELNKVIAAVLTAGVIASASGFIAHLMLQRETIAEHAYPIYAGEATPTETATVAAPALEPIEPLMAAADAEAGVKVAKKCTSCHSFEEGGGNKIGPNLYGVLGRPIASAEGFGYSAALQEKSGETWGYANLNAFLAKPKDWAPGTKMAFAGVKKADDRADLVAYMRSLAASPLPLPE